MRSLKRVFCFKILFGTKIFLYKKVYNIYLYHNYEYRSWCLSLISWVKRMDYYKDSSWNCRGGLSGTELLGRFYCIERAWEC